MKLDRKLNLDQTLFKEVGIVRNDLQPEGSTDHADVSRCDLCHEAFYDDPDWKLKPNRRYFLTLDNEALIVCERCLPEYLDDPIPDHVAQPKATP